jgi:hypothetical protein
MGWITPQNGAKSVSRGKIVNTALRLETIDQSDSDE